MICSRHAIFRFGTALATIATILASASAQTQPATTGDAQSEAAQTENPKPEIQDIVVTGSRLKTGFSAPTPVSVLGADRLQQRAAANIGDALNELPSFRATQTPSSTGQNPTAGYVGGRILDLRGLGAVRTLTLVDGKRFVPSTTQATVDTNMIPSILLSRAEVVTGGASAQYGSDAVAGVVNLILDKKLEGIKGNIQGGVSRQGDNADIQAGLAGGWALSDTLHLVVGGEYERNRGVGDCQQRDWCRSETINWGRNPGDTSVPANNILQNGRSSTTPFNGVIVPVGYSGLQPVLGPLGGITFNDDGSARAFQYGSMVNPILMVGGEGAGKMILFRSLNIVAPTERYNAAGHLNWEVAPDLTAGLDVNYGHLSAQYASVAYRNPAISIKRDNPFIPTSSNPAYDVQGILNANPQIASFNLGRGFADIGPGDIRTKNSVFRAVASLEGKISDNWSFDAYYQFGRNDFRSETRNATISSRVLRAIDAVRNGSGQIVCRVNADASTTNDDAACAPFNPFGQQASAAALNYVIGTALQTNKTTEHVAAANLRGSLFTLPYGDVSVATGGEFRSDKVVGGTDTISQSLGFWQGNGALISGKIDVIEGFVETQLPLLAGLDYANELSLNGAVRRTHYKRSSAFSPSSTVNVTTWKVGAVYEPISAIRFRATRSRDIRAPNISELFGPTTVTIGILNDPSRGGQQTSPQVFSGSNPNLTPEIADTLTAGIVLKPQGGFIGRFRLSVDYYDIKIKGAISTLGSQNIATRCFQGDTLSCSLLTRDAGGTITSVNDTLRNVNEQITRGIDAELTYSQPLGNLGSLDLRLLGTYVKDLITVDTIGSVQRAGQTGLRVGTPAGIPDFTGDALITWNYGNLSLNTHIRYINKGFYNAAFVGAEQAGYSQAALNSSNTNAVPSRTYVDLMAQVSIGKGEARNMTFYVGVDNVFDIDPPLIPGFNGTGNNVLFNPIGQTFKAGVRFGL